MVTLFRGRYWRNGETARLDDRFVLQFKSRPRSLRVIPQRSDSDRPAPPFTVDDPAWQSYYDRLRQADRSTALQAIKQMDPIAAARLSRLDTAAILQEYSNLLAAIAEVALDAEPLRLDSAPPLRRVVKWKDLEIGITHEDGDSRFVGGRPLVGCAYGHLRRSYPRAPDKKAIDVYWGGNAESPLSYQVYQKDPMTGVMDERKLMLGFGDIDSARAAYTRHAGLGRFGGIEEVPYDTVSGYRIDACGCKTLDEALQSGGALLSEASLDQLAQLPHTPADRKPEVLLAVLQSAYPTEILRVTKWQIETKDDRPEYSGEFAAPIGIYGWRIDPGKGRLAYRWQREMGTARIDRASPRPRSRRSRSDAKPPDLSVLDGEDADLVLSRWLAAHARKAIAPWTREVVAFAEECGSLESLNDRLPELFDRLPANNLFRAYDRAMALAYRLGQSNLEIPDE